LKVCMLVRNPVVRDARVLREAAALASAGHDVTILAIAEKGLPSDEAKGGYRIHRFDPIPRWQRAISRALGRSGAPARPNANANANASLRRRPWLRTLLYDRAVSMAFARAARAIPADVYHAHDLNMLRPALAAARTNGARVVYDAHEIYPEMNGLTSRERARWAKVERALIGGATRVVTVNESVAHELVKRYQIPAPIIVMNVPDPSTVTTGTRIASLEGAGTKILYIGWIVPGRGLEQAVEALTHLEEGTLVLLGADRHGYGERLTLLAARLGVDDRVAFAGAVPPEDVVGVAARASLGLCTIRNVGLSYYLSLPNKMFEYIHAGLPVVASDFPELRRLVDGFGLGAVCDPDDPRSIAKAIDRVRAERDRMAEGSRRAAEAFTWSGESQKLLGVYAGLAGS
jgi:glycosyltransferase involved in cell wall biosynthesis